MELGDLEDKLLSLRVHGYLDGIVTRLIDICGCVNPPEQSTDRETDERAAAWCASSTTTALNFSGLYFSSRLGLIRDWYVAIVLHSSAQRISVNTR